MEARRAKQENNGTSKMNFHFESSQLDIRLYNFIIY